MPISARPAPIGWWIIAAEFPPRKTSNGAACASPFAEHQPTAPATTLSTRALSASLDSPHLWSLHVSIPTGDSRLDRCVPLPLEFHRFRSNGVDDAAFPDVCSVR